MKKTDNSARETTNSRGLEKENEFKKRDVAERIGKPYCSLTKVVKREKKHVVGGPLYRDIKRSGRTQKETETSTPVRTENSPKKGTGVKEIRRSLNHLLGGPPVRNIKRTQPEKNHRYT